MIHKIKKQATPGAKLQTLIILKETLVQQFYDYTDIKETYLDKIDQDLYIGVLCYCILKSREE